MNAHERLVSALRTHTPIVGSWLQMGSASAAEILAGAGFAWLGLDCEHTSADMAAVEDVARALQGRDTALLVRVTQCDPLEIRRCLDVGASGVIVPMVETAAQARRAVSAAKYPPSGTRGYCFGRMNGWGSAFADYAQRANEQTLVIVMIESRAGVENIHAILEVDGINAVFIGPYDLSGSYGLPGQVQHDIVQRAQKAVIAACRDANIVVGQHIVHSNEAKIAAALAEGFTFLCLDGDSIFLSAAARLSLASAKLPPLREA